MYNKATLGKEGNRLDNDERRGRQFALTLLFVHKCKQSYSSYDNTHPFYIFNS